MPAAETTANLDLDALERKFTEPYPAEPDLPLADDDGICIPRSEGLALIQRLREFDGGLTAKAWSLVQEHMAEAFGRLREAESDFETWWQSDPVIHNEALYDIAARAYAAGYRRGPRPHNFEPSIFDAADCRICGMVESYITHRDDYIAQLERVREAAQALAAKATESYSMDPKYWTAVWGSDVEQLRAALAALEGEEG